MKATFDVKHLKAALKSVKPFMAKKPVLDFLRSVRICKTNGVLVARVVDNANFYTFTEYIFNATLSKADDGFDIVINYNSLTDFLKSVKTGDVVLEMAEKNGINIMVGAMKSTMNGDDVKEFPIDESLKDAHKEETYAINMGKDYGKEIVKFCGDDLLRPVMNGPVMEFGTDALCASDGRKLLARHIGVTSAKYNWTHRKKHDIAEPDDSDYIIFPRHAAAAMSGHMKVEVYRSFHPAADNKSWSASRPRIVMTCIDSNIRMTFDPIECRYPNWRSVVPRYSIDCAVDVDNTKEFMNAVNQIAPVVNPGCELMDLNVGEDHTMLNVHGKDIDFNREGSVQVKLKTPVSGRFAIGLKQGILAKCMPKDWTGRMYIADPSRAMVFELEKDGIFLLMPMMLNDGVTDTRKICSMEQTNHAAAFNRKRDNERRAEVEEKMKPIKKVYDEEHAKHPDSVVAFVFDDGMTYFYWDDCNKLKQYRVASCLCYNEADVPFVMWSKDSADNRLKILVDNGASLTIMYPDRIDTNATDDDEPLSDDELELDELLPLADDELELDELLSVA